MSDDYDDAIEREEDHFDLAAKAEEAYRAVEEGRTVECRVSAGGCGHFFPDDNEHWHRNGDGRRTVCKACRNRIEREREEGKRLKELKRFDDHLRGMLSEAALSGGSGIPHQAEIYELLMRAFGGPQGFVNQYVAQLIAAPIGGPVRQKMLADLLRMSNQLSEGGHVGKQVEQMSDEEIIERTRRLLQEAAQRDLITRRREAEETPLAAIPTLREIQKHGPPTS